MGDYKLRREFDDALASANDAIRELARAKDYEARKTIDRRATNAISIAEKKLNLMSDRPSSLTARLEDAVRSLRRASSTATTDSDRARLFEGAKARGAQDLSESGFWRGDADSEHLDRTTASLLDTSRTLDESTRIGVGVVEELRDQRDLIVEAQRDVDETNTLTGQARVVLKRLANRALYNRLFLYTVVGVLGGAIALILYFDFLKKR